MPLKRESIFYNTGFVPVDNGQNYQELKEQYLQFGKLPPILKIAGIAFDATENLNHWSLDESYFDTVAKAMVGMQIRKDHSDKADDVIGKIRQAFRDKDNHWVWFQGEISDRSMIEKILLGYLDSTSVQITAPDVYCTTCLKNTEVKEQEAKIEVMDAPCPRCGGYKLFIKNYMPIEQSIVALPAYPSAKMQPLGFEGQEKTTPFGFSNAMNRLFASRFNNLKYSNSHIDINDEATLQGIEGSGLRNHPARLFNMSSSTAAPAGEMTPAGKGYEYDSATKGFADQLKEIKKYCEMAYKLQLESVRIQKKRAALEEQRFKLLTASYSPTMHSEETPASVTGVSQKMEEDEEARKSEEARKHEEEVTKQRKLEELRHKLEEAKAGIEDAKKKREASKQQSEVPKGVVGDALSGKEGTNSLNSGGSMTLPNGAQDNVPQSTKDMFAELQGLWASAKKQGVIEA